MTRARPDRIPSENDLPIRPSASSKLSTVVEVTTTELLQTQSVNQAWWHNCRQSRCNDGHWRVRRIASRAKSDVDSKGSTRGRTLESRNIGQGTTDISGGTWDQASRWIAGCYFVRWSDRLPFSTLVERLMFAWSAE